MRRCAWPHPSIRHRPIRSPRRLWPRHRPGNWFSLLLLMSSRSSGEGLSGKVEGKTTAIGGLDYVRKHARGNLNLLTTVNAEAGMVLTSLAISGKVAALFGLADKPREELAHSPRCTAPHGYSPHHLGKRRSPGSRRRDRARPAIRPRAGDLDPDAKVTIVHAEAKQGPVMMVGDGISHAPALAAANVGVAMGATGAAASSKTADVVIVQHRWMPCCRRSRSHGVAAASRSSVDDLVGRQAPEGGLLFVTFGEDATR